MSTQLGIDEVQTKLKDLIAQLGPDDELVITQDSRPVARLTAFPSPQPRFGSCQGLLIINQEDDEHLADFQDYMP